MQSNGKPGKWLHHIALFRMEYLLLGRGINRVGVGVDIFRPEPESESESLEIPRLSSPGGSSPISGMRFIHVASVVYLRMRTCAPFSYLGNDWTHRAKNEVCC